MAFLSTREDFMSRINSLVGDRTDDEALGIIADLSDTYGELSKKEVVNVDELNSNWQAKYDALDNEWRNKYKDRFMNNPSKVEDKDFHAPNPENDNPDNIEKFEDLFK